jgi:hypothetical protein
MREEAQEPAVVAIAQSPDRETPGPSHAVIPAHAFDSGAMEGVGRDVLKAIRDKGRPEMGSVGRFRRAVGGKDVAIVIGVVLEKKRDLAEVVEAGRTMGFLLGFRQGRQQKRRQDRDDGNDHQQFDQGKSCASGPADAENLASISSHHITVSDEHRPLRENYTP